MKEVGNQWQSLTKEQRKYFKDKADKDKVRYLNEQKAFYDEVEKIGQKVGTVTTKEGQVVVASAVYSQEEFGKNKNKIPKSQMIAALSAQGNSMVNGQLINQMGGVVYDNGQMIQARSNLNPKLINLLIGIGVPGESPNKRLKG